MNLYLRLIVSIIRGFFKPTMSLSDTLRRELRVLPNDIDINGHLNNGRCMTILDLFMLELCLRTKVLMPAIRKGWKPMLGGNVVTYRRQLSIFEKYRANFRILCLDEKWTYFQYALYNSAGEMVVAGYSKGAWVGRKGLVPNAVIQEKLNVEAPDRPMPQAIRSWLDAETGILNGDWQFD